jgi:hypothetical protein
VRLFAHELDASLKTVVAQRNGNLHAGLTGPHNQDVRHD